MTCKQIYLMALWNLLHHKGIALIQARKLELSSTRAEVQNIY